MQDAPHPPPALQGVLGWGGRGALGFSARRKKKLALCAEKIEGTKILHAKNYEEGKAGTSTKDVQT